MDKAKTIQVFKAFYIKTLFGSYDGMINDVCYKDDKSIYVDNIIIYNFILYRT